MKKPKVSIIIPVYNAEKYLSECLDSVVNQSLKDIEIICVNDGSTDESLNILNEYSKKNSNLKIINQKNSGVIAARIAGYNATTGEYIGWVDADDYVSHDMFKNMLNLAEEKSADMVYCNYNFFPDKVINKQKWYKPYNGLLSWEIILNNTIQWNKLVKRDLLDKLNITELFDKIGEGCYGLVFINANKIVSTDECLYNYRVGHTSLSSNFNNINWYKKVVERSKNLLDYVTNNSYDFDWITYYNYRYLYYHLILMIVASYANDKQTYNDSKLILKSEKLFSKKYSKYMKKSFSKSKILFLKYIGTKSFLLMRLAARLLLK